MTTPTHKPAPHARAARRWPLALAAALALQAAAVIAMVAVASRDPSFAVEPDYYQRAVEWDAYAAQREASRALRWTAALSIAPASPQRTIELTLTNADGAPLDGADVTLELFHHAAAADRTVLHLAPARPGVYTATANLARTGLHEARLTARRGPDAFLVRTTIDITHSAVSRTLEDAK